MADERQAETAAAAPAPAPATAGPGHPQRTDAEAAAAIEEAAYDLRFELTWLECYHSDRASWLRRVNKAGSFVVALLGTGVVGGALGGAPGLAALAGFVTTAIGVGESIFDMAGAASRHERQIERVRNLLADLAAQRDDMATIRALDAKRLALEPVEAFYHAVSALAWNTTYLALSRAPNNEHCLIVSPAKRWRRHLRRYAPTSFRSDAERREAGEASKP